MRMPSSLRLNVKQFSVRLIRCDACNYCVRAVLLFRLPSRLSTVGSFWWMAPECITNRPYNQRADVFSFGVILLELVSRLSADPDVLLRTPAFGIDYLAFSGVCPRDCNLEMLLLAFTCCVVSVRGGGDQEGSVVSGRTRGQ